MSVDASAVARVVGIATEFKDLRGGQILLLPQRIAVVAQGATAATYSNDKATVTSAFDVGSTYGFGSPLHLACRELFPSNGDGVGTIPVTVFPLDDDGSGVASTGDIAPTGSQTTQASYIVRINELDSETFVIPVGTSVTDVCALIGQAIEAVVELPVTVTYTYGTVTATPDAGNAGDGTVTALSVTGTPLPGDYLLTLITVVADGGVFTLTDPNGTIIDSAVTMTPAPLGTTVINTNGLQFTITDGAADFELADFFTIAVPATDVQLTSKWKGVSANDIFVEVIGEALGTTFTVTQPVGGLVNPDVDDGLNLVGDIWETLFLNAMESSDTATLAKFATFGETRWGQLVRKPMVAFSGNTDATVAAATTVPAARRTDRTNAQLVAPGSNNLPFVVAARQLARIAVVANQNPPTDYGSQSATGLVPGNDEDQWDYADRNLAVTTGSSTITVKDGVVSMADSITYYRPSGDPTPAYRFVVDIVKIMQVLFNLDLIFAVPEWDGAPLIPDSQPTTNPNARKPKSATAAVAAMLDSLGLAAIISDPETAKGTIVSAIDSGNPKRLNVAVTVQLAGNANIISVDLSFGFFFGTPAVVA